MDLGFLRRSLGLLLLPLQRFIVVHSKVANPWEVASSVLIRSERFGAGSRKLFWAYLRGKAK
jgi:hypothetical protein